MLHVSSIFPIAEATVHPTHLSLLPLSQCFTSLHHAFPWLKLLSTLHTSPCFHSHNASHPSIMLSHGSSNCPPYTPLLASTLTMLHIPPSCFPMAQATVHPAHLSLLPLSQCFTSLHHAFPWLKQLSTLHTSPCFHSHNASHPSIMLSHGSSNCPPCAPHLASTLTMLHIPPSCFPMAQATVHPAHLSLLQLSQCFTSLHHAFPWLKQLSTLHTSPCFMPPSVPPLAAA